MSDSFLLPTSAVFDGADDFDRIHQSIIDLNLDPPEFDEIKDLIAHCFDLLNNPDLNQDLAQEINSLIISASKTYPENLWTFMEKIFPKIRTNDDIPNKKCLVVSFCQCVHALIHIHKTPQSDELKQFYDLILEELKKVAPNFNQNITIFNVPIMAARLIKIAIMTHPFTVENLSPFVSYLFSSDESPRKTIKYKAATVRIFSEAPASVFLKIVPSSAQAPSFLSFLPNEKSIEILQLASASQLKIFLISRGWSRLDKCVLLALLNKMIRTYQRLKYESFYVLEEIFPKLDITDFTDETISILAKSRILIPTVLAQQITTYEDAKRFLPIMHSLNTLPDEISVQLIRDAADAKSLLQILKLKPRLPILADFNYWMDIAKKYGMDIRGAFKDTFIMNVANYETHYVEIIKTLDQDVAFMILNEILESKVQNFVALCQIPEYLDLLNKVNKPIAKIVAYNLDLSDLPFSKLLDENTPAPIWFLYAFNSLINGFDKFTIKMPPLPHLTDETIKQILESTTRSIFNLSGKDQLMFGSAALLTSYAQSKGIKFHIESQLDILMFIALYIKSSRIINTDFAILSPKSVFEGSDQAPIYSLSTMKAPLDELTSKIAQYILTDILYIIMKFYRYRPQLFTFILDTFKQLLEQHIYETNPEIMKLIATSLELLLQKPQKSISNKALELVNAYLEPFVFGLFQANRKPSKITLNKLNKTDIQNILLKLFDNKEFKDYAICYKSILPDLFKNQPEPKTEQRSTEEEDNNNLEEEDDYEYDYSDYDNDILPEMDEEEDIIHINADDLEFNNIAGLHPENILSGRIRPRPGFSRLYMQRRHRYMFYPPEEEQDIIDENQDQQQPNTSPADENEQKPTSEEEKLTNPNIIAKHAKLSPTDVLKQIYSLDDIIKIIGDIDKKYVGVIENLLVNLLRDEETNTQYIQYMLGKIGDPLCVPLDFFAYTFYNYFNRPQSLAKAFDSLYVPTGERPTTFFRRVKPLELKPPSEFTMTLLNSILDLVETKPTFVVFEALFFLAQFYLPIFKYTKKTSTDIFNLVFEKMSYNESDQYYSSFIPAAVFLDYYLEQPQFSDAFFDWVFERINGFSDVQLTVALALIQTKLKRTQTAFITITKLMKANWPQYPPELLVKNYSQAFSSSIINQIIDITSIFFNAMNNMNDSSAISYSALVECPNAFTKIFCCLPMESLYKQTNIIYHLPFAVTSDSKKLFNYRIHFRPTENMNAVQKFKTIIQSNPRTPDQLPDDFELPPSINKEAFLNMPEIMQSTVLQTILYQNQYTQDFQMQSACEEPWVGYILKMKPRNLMLPSHYLKVYEVLKRSQEQQLEEFPTQDTVAFEFFLQPDLISCLTKISFTDKLKTLIHIISSNAIMSSALIDFVNENIESAGKGVFYTLVYIVHSICETDLKDSIDESLVEQLLHYGLMVKNINQNVLIKMAHIILALNFYPKQISHLLGFCLIQNSNCAQFALQIYKKLSKEQQADVAYLVSNAFKQAIKTKSSQLSQFVTQCPEMAAAHSKELLDFLDSLLQKGIPESKLAVIGAIINTLAPEPGSLSLSTPEGSFKANVSTSASTDPQIPASKLPLPASVIAQNPDFWNLIAKHIDKLRAITQKSPDLIQSTFSFFSKYPKLLSFEQRHKYLISTMSNTISGSHINITVNRASILDDTFKNLGLSPPEKFRHHFHISYVGERGYDAGGLTIDWFVKVVQELFNPIYGLFIPSENGLSFQPFVNSSINLDQHMKYFQFAGRFIARAIIEGVAVPAHLTHGVLKKILGHSLTLRDLEAVDPELYRSLTFIKDNYIEDIGLTFTTQFESFGRYYTVKLKKDGDQIDLTEENKEEYIQLMLEHRLYGQTKAQIDAFVHGFLSIIPRENLKSFTSNELDLIICGLPDISIDDLEKNVEFIGPYSHHSQTIKDLFAILRSWDTTKRSLFLIFVTSSSNVPVGGFGQMSKPFRIQWVSDSNKLPEAHTCFNQLDLPDYKSYVTLEEKLLFAIQNTESFEKA